MRYYIIVKCCLCGETLRYRETNNERFHMKVSHTICKTCLPEYERLYLTPNIKREVEL